ncbi:unnamed protein product [Urochloa humidicola]
MASSTSSSSSSSASDSDVESPLPNTLCVTSVPAPPMVVHGINIQSRVPIVLDLDDANYTVWTRAFSAVFGQYGLGDHVDGSDPKGDSDWVQNDCAIVSWLYNRVTPDLLAAISTNDDTTSSLWCGIRALFLANKNTRAVYRNAEFRSFLQGDLPVFTYCTRMKTMADRLGDLGSPITNADLIQNIICGLNPRLHHYVPHLTVRKRLPTFHKARSMLQIEEQRLAESEKLQAASALIAQAHQAQLGGTPPTTTTGIPGGSSSSNNTRPPSSSTPSKKKKKPTSTGTPSSTARAPTSPSSSAGFSPNINPWTGVVQAWPSPPAPRSGGGLLGARPPGTAPQAHVAGSTPSTMPST